MGGNASHEFASADNAICRQKIEKQNVNRQGYMGRGQDDAQDTQLLFIFIYIYVLPHPGALSPGTPSPGIPRPLDLSETLMPLSVRQVVTAFFHPERRKSPFMYTSSLGNRRHNDRYSG